MWFLGGWQKANENTLRRMRVLTLTPFYPSASDDAEGCFIAEPLRELNQFAIGIETKYNDMFDSPGLRPLTLTNGEANRAIRSRYDSPLDPDKPSTRKAKHESLTPPAGKVGFSND